MVDKANLQKRIDKALQLRAQGYNCAQCVAMVFNPGLEAVASGMGTGVAGTGHICGAVSAMALVSGVRSYTSPGDKQTLYALIRTRIAAFADMNCGDTDCRGLRKPGRKPCADLIKDAVTILHESIN